MEFFYDGNYVDLNENARKEELSAYLFLQHNIFKDAPTIVGDNPNHNKNKQSNCCDIYTENMTYGVEIVTCEDDKTYQENSAFYGPLNEEVLQLNVNNNQNISDKLVNAFSAPCCDQPAENREGSKYLSLFKKQVKLKLAKLCKGNYNGISKVSLAVMSFASDKPVDIEQIAETYKDLCRDYHKKFYELFVFINKKVYKINRQYNISVVNGWVNKNEFVK